MKIYARTKLYHRIAENKGLKADVFLCKNCIYIRGGIIYDDSKLETIYFRFEVSHINEYRNIEKRMLENNATQRLAKEVKYILDMWHYFEDFSFSVDGWYMVKGGQNNGK